MGRSRLKVVIPGGTGSIGTVLAKHFHEAGDDVTVIARSTARNARWRTVVWDGGTLGDWAQAIDGADVVINLAGRSVNCRYTPENRRIIIESRTTTTRLVGQAIAAANKRPRTWMNASTATIYRHALDRPQDEKTGELGGDEPGAPAKWNFSIDVATAWERAFVDAAAPGVRKIILRLAIVMEPYTHSTLALLSGLVRKGLGGANGSGSQRVSWVHDVDLARTIEFLIASEDTDGIINVSSPNPVPNRDFMRALRDAMGVKIGLPATEPMLRVGAFLMGSETELVLKSRWVLPTRLLESGFTFTYPTWPEAARDLVRRAHTEAS
ncbi:MAG TPA: TIGR01777 family oxidoreductase [Candidatus Eremiobacteraceae bacterium]|nr:TIGR01777 family oxidoreductase [Candidatus Eremiobacteraceae bacterium]